MSDPRASWVIEPFVVLDAPREATRAELERAAQKLIAQLQVGVASAAEVVTPLGTVQRTEDMVRWAIAELRIPDRRAVWEARGRALPEPGPPPPVVPDPAMKALGWARS